MTRTQITLDPELQRHALERATTLGISLTEYIRRLLARDLEQPQQPVDPALIFDLGISLAALRIGNFKAFADTQRIPFKKSVEVMP